MNCSKLDISRQAGAKTVDIDTPDVSLFRFQEQLVPVAVAKTVNLVFDTRAVARALAVNTAAEHRTVLEAAAQDVVRLDVRARNPTDTIIADKLVNLVAPKFIRISIFVKMAIAHRPRFIVTALYIAFIKVYRIRI